MAVLGGKCRTASSALDYGVLVASQANSPRIYLLVLQNRVERKHVVQLPYAGFVRHLFDLGTIFDDRAITPLT